MICVRVPDTNEAKELMKFCRKFTVPLRSATSGKLLLAKKPKPSRSFHVFIAPAVAMSVILTRIITLRSAWGSASEVPVRCTAASTLKLEEVFHMFIPYDEWEERLKAGLQAVDPGMPGSGWTYQLGETQYACSGRG